MARTKTQIILRYGLYGLAGLGVAGTLIYFFVIRTIQIHNQKQNFAKAEASLDALEKQIEAKVGKPDEIKKEKSCSYASRVYEKGPRGCGVSIFLLYRNRNYTAANNILALASAITGTKIYDQLGRSSINQFHTKEENGTDQAFSQTIDNTLGLDCSIQYLYPVYPVLTKTFENLANENVQIELSCGGQAMAEFFTVKD